MTSVEVGQRTKVKDVVAVSQSLKETGRTCGKNGPVQMGTNCNNMRRQNRQKEKWAAEDPMGLYVLEGSSRTMVTNSKNPEQMN